MSTMFKIASLLLLLLLIGKVASVTSQDVRRVLVIGSSGAGKSTLINALAGKKVVETSSDATGCTSSYTKTEVEKDGLLYEFVDTVGLNEIQSGTVSQKDALKMFFSFLKENQEGFNLIIFCLKEERLTNEGTATYKVMVRDLYSQSKEEPPPVLLAVGGMFVSQEHPQHWCDKNRGTFLLAGYKEAHDQLNQLHCFSLPDTSPNPIFERIFKEAREESVYRAWEAVQSKITPSPRPLYQSYNEFIQLVISMWNDIVDLMENIPDPTYTYKNIKEFLGLYKIGFESMYEDFKSFLKDDEAYWH